MDAPAQTTTAGENTALAPCGVPLTDSSAATQADPCTAHATLICVDPAKHMDRRYSVIVQATLLEPLAVVCVWGSRRSRYQRLHVVPAASRDEAMKLAEKIVRGKLSHGYRPG